jgi:predicted O-methyltransferase YrrM
MNKIDYIVRYLRYHFAKKGKHGIHSPFVYDLIINVLEDKKDYPEYNILDKARKNLLHNHDTIETVDFGAEAGNKEFITYRSSVRKLTKLRAQSVAELRIMFRLVKYFKPRNILEFGTSTGLSTIALALANPTSKIISMEGCASVASVAENQFQKYHLHNIDLVIGNFNNTLTDVLEKVEQLDFVFFDGNHRKIPTIDYFNHCLTKAGQKSVFIIDDIHWSDEMEEAWTEIIADQSVTLSIDLFHFGMIFFDKGFSKQHFVISN